MDNPIPHEQPDAPVAEAIVKKRSRVSAIWILPLVVVAAGIWLVYHSYRERGTDITILFEKGQGIQSGKTLIKYKGVEIGNVTNVDLTKDDKVSVQATLKPMGIDFAKKETNFWLVSPRIDAQGVSGLETIVSGSYIGVRQGTGEKAVKFTALSEPPPFISETYKPLRITLLTPRLGSCKVGTPIYYREIKVGEVTDYNLSKVANQVIINAVIEHPYAPLVRTNSKFWNASGIAAKLGITGVKIKTESLTSILAGGIAFASPNNDKIGKRAVNGAKFELHAERKEVWREWAPKIQIKIPQ